MNRWNKYLITLSALAMLNASISAMFTRTGQQTVTRTGRELGRIGTRQVRRIGTSSGWTIAPNAITATTTARQAALLANPLKQDLISETGSRRLGEALAHSVQENIAAAPDLLARYNSKPSAAAYEYLLQRFNPANAPSALAAQVYRNILNQVRPPASSSVLQELWQTGRQSIEEAARRGEQAARETEERAALAAPTGTPTRLFNRLNPRTQHRAQQNAQRAAEYEQGLTEQLTSPGFEPEPATEGWWSWAKRRGQSLMGRAQAEAQKREGIARASEAAQRRQEAALQTAREQAEQRSKESFIKSGQREGNLEREAQYETMKQKFPEVEAQRQQEIEESMYR